MEKLALIETKRKEALIQLYQQYKFKDKVKSSFGYIAIASLSLLWGAIVLNDLSKLIHFCCGEIKILLSERREKRNKIKAEKEKEDEEVKIQMEISSQDLEEKLEQFHLQLVKVCARNKKRLANSQ